jgi:hypothetical protein
MEDGWDARGSSGGEPTTAPLEVPLAGRFQVQRQETTAVCGGVQRQDVLACAGMKKGTTTTTGSVQLRKKLGRNPRTSRRRVSSRCTRVHHHLRQEPREDIGNDQQQQQLRCWNGSITRSTNLAACRNLTQMKRGDERAHKYQTIQALLMRGMSMVEGERQSNTTSEELTLQTWTWRVRSHLVAQV